MADRHGKVRQGDALYLVCRSNCGEWEDYSWWVDSAWSTRELAVGHIEERLGLEPAGSDGGRWWRTFYGYPSREGMSDEEWESWHDEDGNLIPDYSESTDAWVMELKLDDVEGWMQAYNVEEG